MRTSRFFSIFRILLPVVACGFLAGGCSRETSEERGTPREPEAAGDHAAFVKAELGWRAEREREMRSPTSWLTIAGLFWLEEGENTFGADPSNDIRLPEGSAPPFAGVFVMRGAEVTVRGAPDAGLTVGGEPIGETKLASDGTDNPTIVALGDLRMWVIERGERRAIRLRDLKAPRFTAFKGLSFYPPREEFRIEGTLHRYPVPRTVVLATVVGTEAAVVSPGYVTFRIGETELLLDAFDAGRDSTQLFIIFKDRTSGEETYGACRFMEAAVVAGSKVDLNFNRAYNPPCAYTPYATCPLPPQRNEFPVRIEAGEKRYGEEH